jgi:hypothetical protein
VLGALLGIAPVFWAVTRDVVAGGGGCFKVLGIVFTAFVTFHGSAEDFVVALLLLSPVTDGPRFAGCCELSEVVRLGDTSISEALSSLLRGTDSVSEV